MQKYNFCFLSYTLFFVSSVFCMDFSLVTKFAEEDFREDVIKYCLMKELVSTYNTKDLDKEIGKKFGALQKDRHMVQYRVSPAALLDSDDKSEDSLFKLNSGKSSEVFENQLRLAKRTSIADALFGKSTADILFSSCDVLPGKEKERCHGTYLDDYFYLPREFEETVYKFPHTFIEQPPTK